MLRKKPLSDAFEIDGIGRHGSGLVDGLRGELEELFGRKRVVADV